MKGTLEGIPKDLIYPIGNLLRKIAYTQLNAIRCVGFSIILDGKPLLQTSTIDGTTSVLDVAVALAKAKKKIDFMKVIKDTSEVVVIQENFTNLNNILLNYFDKDSLPEDILVLSDLKKSAVIRLYFMNISKDMSDKEIVPYLSPTDIAIPATILDKFVLDYSEMDNGVLHFEISEEFDEQFANKIKEIANLIKV